MLRVVFTTLSFLSLLLGVGAAILWPRSLLVSDGVGFEWRGQLWAANTTHGWLALFRVEGATPTANQLYFSTDWRWMHQTNRPPVPERALAGERVYRRFAGFVIGYTEALPGMRCWTLGVPFWFLVLLFAMAPARWWYLFRGRWRRERRLLHGLCPTCGYDLRASPERCPECGFVRNSGRATRVSTAGTAPLSRSAEQ